MLKTSIYIQGNEYPFLFISNMQKCVDFLFDINTDKYFIIYDNKLCQDNIDFIKEKLSIKCQCDMLSLQIEEQNKKIQLLEFIINFMFENKVSNMSSIIAVGGGVLGNVVGIAAGLIYRGIKLVHIPTTVIAAADSTLSLKQAINHANSKNSIGVFHAPHCVITEYSFFKTLPQREYKSGIVETIKNILCIQPELICEFKDKMKTGLNYSNEELEYIIKISISAKAQVLKNDMTERNEGLVLEYGHTVGHALELLSNGEINHGEGVAFGMLVMAEISRDMGFLNDEEVNMHYNLLNVIDMMCELKPIKKYPIDGILDMIKNDNKRGYLFEKRNENPMIMLKSIGECCIQDKRRITYIHDEYLYRNIPKVMGYL